MNALQSILFDLDGTLLDTAADLATALNKIFVEENLPALSLEKIRPIINEGFHHLLKLGIDVTPNTTYYNQLRERFFHYYEENLTNQTKFFVGIEKILNILKQKKISWGIVTNKPMRFTHPLQQRISLLKQAKCIVSGDTLPYQKPHPEPLEYACRLLNCNTENCIYVGDAKTDIIAANQAKMRALVALYGYIPHDQNPQEWQADGYLTQPMDLMKWLIA